MGVFSFIGRMFGSEKSVDAMVTSLSNGLDKLVYTDEEKADAAAIDRANARSMLIEWMDKTQGQNIVRRMLATIIAFTWLSQYFITGLLNFLAVWKEDPDVVKKLHLAANVTQENVDGMTGSGNGSIRGEVEWECNVGPNRKLVAELGKSLHLCLSGANGDGKNDQESFNNDAAGNDSCQHVSCRWR
jgi:hypothetical protein